MPRKSVTAKAPAVAPGSPAEDDVDLVEEVEQEVEQDAVASTAIVTSPVSCGILVKAASATSAASATAGGEINSAWIGISTFNHNTSEFEICELNDKGNFANLETCLLQMNPNNGIYIHVCDAKLEKKTKLKILEVVESATGCVNVTQTNGTNGNRSKGKGGGMSGSSGMFGSNSLYANPGQPQKSLLTSIAMSKHNDEGERNADGENADGKRQKQSLASMVAMTKIDESNPGSTTMGIVSFMQETTKGFTQENGKDGLKTLLGEDVLRQAELSYFDNELLMATTGGLISNLNLLTDSDGTVNPLYPNSVYDTMNGTITNSGSMSNALHIGKCTIQSYTGLSNYLKLDKAAFSALHILPSDKSQHRSPTSVFGFLNRCRTPMGGRLLVSWLRQPLTKKEDIETRHTFVEALVEDQQLLKSIHQSLSSVCDLDKIVLRLQKVASGSPNASNLEDLYAVWRALQTCCDLIEEFSGSDCFNNNGNLNNGNVHKEVIEREFLNPLAKLLNNFGKYIELIETTIDMERAMENSMRIMVNPEFDPQFYALSQSQKKLQQEMDGNVEKVNRLIGGGCILYEHINNEKVFRVTKKEHQKVQQNAEKIGKGFVAVLLKKNEFLFTTKSMQDLNKKKAQAEEDYVKAQTELVAKCVKIGSTFSSVIAKLSSLLGKLDLLASFALVSTCSSADFVRPKLSQRIALHECTHPLAQENSIYKEFVGNDVIMEKEKGRFLMISGPNMGGKSTFIRQVAIAALLNQIGMFVPCKNWNSKNQPPEMPIFESLFTRVGASDSHLKGISTFMLEMLEASTILQEANQNSLVLVDELGRGTSTEDGYGLAFAIARYLSLRMKCFTLFATHFHELGELEREMETETGTRIVQNRHAAAETNAKGEIEFKYEMRDGIADQSYGVECAKKAEFPREAISFAQNHVQFLEKNYKFLGKKHLETVDSNALNEAPSLKRRKILFDEFGVANARELCKKISTLTTSEDEFAVTMQRCAEKIAGA